MCKTDNRRIGREKMMVSSVCPVRNIHSKNRDVRFGQFVWPLPTTRNQIITFQMSEAELSAPRRLDCSKNSKCNKRIKYTKKFLTIFQLGPTSHPIKNRRVLPQYYNMKVTCFMSRITVICCRAPTYFDKSSCLATNSRLVESFEDRFKGSNSISRVR